MEQRTSKPFRAFRRLQKKKKKKEGEEEEEKEKNKKMSVLCFRVLIIASSCSSFSVPPIGLLSSAAYLDLECADEVLGLNDILHDVFEE